MYQSTIFNETIELLEKVEPWTITSVFNYVLVLSGLAVIGYVGYHLSQGQTRQEEASQAHSRDERGETSRRQDLGADDLHAASEVESCQASNRIGIEERIQEKRLERWIGEAQFEEEWEQCRQSISYSQSIDQSNHFIQHSIQFIDPFLFVSSRRCYSKLMSEYKRK